MILCNFREFVFAGNRAYVFQRALELGLEFKRVYVARDSYLMRFCEGRGIPFCEIQSKQELVNELSGLEFDLLVSNGLQYILPISDLKRTGKKEFINVHPSCLPDLKGKNPVTGALLFGRDAGATCHFMDDGIDTGAIISQVRIPYSQDLDSVLLYQLSFMAEADVFEQAYRCGFSNRSVTQSISAPIYYSRSDSDGTIDAEKDNVETACRKVRAFNALKQPALLKVGENEIPVRHAVRMTNPYVIRMAERKEVGDSVFNCRLSEDCVIAIVKLCDGIVYFKSK